MSHYTALELPGSADARWRIEYHNDTGPTDEDFQEWWEVTDERRVCRCAVKADAEWLCGYLNARYAPLRLPDE